MTTVYILTLDTAREGESFHGAFSTLERAQAYDFTYMTSPESLGEWVEVRHGVWKRPIGSGYQTIWICAHELDSAR